MPTGRAARSYPADLILPAGIAGPSTSGEERPAELTSEAGRYRRAVADSDYAQALLTRRLALEWAPTRMVADDPVKGLGQAAREALLWPRLKALLGEPRRKLGLVSSYFVPTAAGVDAFGRMAPRGVNITILTNALKATDVPIVHTGYAKWREPLLRAGVTLYQMRGPAHGEGVERNVTALGSTGSGARGAGSALHAKPFQLMAIACSWAHSTSIPARPISTRSLVLWSRTPHSRLEEFLPRNTFKVQLGEDGRLHWLERVGERTVVHDTEPGTSWWQRTAVAVLSYLSIEWLL